VISTPWWRGVGCAECFVGSIIVVVIVCGGCRVGTVADGGGIGNWSIVPRGCHGGSEYGACGVFCVGEACS